MASTLEQIEQMQKDLQALKDQARNVASVDAFLQGNIEKLMSLEQSMAALGKTLTALVGELVDKKVVTGEAIYERIRKIDEKNEQERISNMLKAGVIKAVDTVEPTSLVVVSQVYVGVTDPTAVQVAEYRVVELPSPFTPAYVRDALVGKKAGEAAVLKSAENGEGQHILTVQEIYSLVEGQREGEQPTENTNEQSK